MRGIIPRIVEDIFKFIEVAPEFFEFTVKVRLGLLFTEIEKIAAASIDCGRMML